MRVLPLARAAVAAWFVSVFAIGWQTASAQYGANDPSFNVADDGRFGVGPNDSVHSVALQPDGRIVLGGYFTQVHGASRKYVARVDSDGGLDPSFTVGTGPNGPVLVTGLQLDGKVLVGGFFTHWNGVTRSGLARLHADGSLDTSFDAGSGPNDRVTKVVVQPDGRIVIVGWFTMVAGAPRSRVARLHPDGSLDASFAASGGADARVSDVVLTPTGELLIAGDFTSYAGVARSRIARIDANGQLDPSFDPGPGPNQSVRSIALQADGRVLIGGVFSAVNVVPRDRVARLMSDGSLDGTFVPIASTGGDVDKLALQPGVGVLVIGAVGNPHRVTRLQLDGSPDATFTQRTSAGDTVTEVRALADGRVLLAGSFHATGVFERSRVARLTSSGLNDASFNPIPGPDHFVRKIVRQSDGAALVLGDFDSYAGAPRWRIARIHANGELDLGFDPGSGPSNWCWDAAVLPDRKILVTGGFTTFNGLPRNRIARLEHDGSVDSSFDPGEGPNHYVRTLAVQPDGRILIGGDFTSVSGHVTRLVARLHHDGSVDTSFTAQVGPSSSDDVRALVIQPDGRILVAGEFYSVAGVGRGGVARLNTDGSLDATFNSNPGVSWYAQTLALQPDGKVLIGGSFFTYNGVACGHIVRVNSDGSIDPTFNALPGVELSSSQIPLVYSMVLQPDGKVLLGGHFGKAGGRLSGCIARLLPNGALDPTFSMVPGAGNAVISMAPEPSGRVLLGGAFTRFGGAARHHIARMIAYTPGPLSYCTSGTSSNGCTPTISSTGTPNLANTSGFTLDVSGVDGQRSGLIFYGLGGRAAEPWAPTSSSWFCVKAPAQRMGVANSGGAAGQCDGAFSTDWLAYVAANPAATGSPFVAGVTVDAQGWYRDPPAPKSTTLSNALEFVTAP